MFRPTCLVFAASLALVGCNMADKEEAQQDDSSNPHYKQAQQDLDNNNPQGAVADYNEALAHNPKLAGAHYELGLVYGDKLNDPVGSIYHFKRFLELAPNSPKKDEVQALIDKQSQAFAASLPNANTSGSGSDQLAPLQTENAALKKQVDDATRTISELQTQLAEAKRHHHGNMEEAASAPAAAIIPVADGTNGANAAPTEPPRATAVDTNAPDITSPPPSASTAAGTNGAPTTPSRTYTVVKGDSIWKIAHKEYPGDTKNGVDKIQEANKDAIGGKPLKIGQVLVIP